MCGKKDKTLFFLLLSFLAVFIWSAIRPHDYFTWSLEVFPAIIALIILAATFKRFRLTTLAYILIWVQAIILLVGGHYTYAEMPIFNWIRDAFGLSRNYYDRLGHFAQGFVPAIIAREILIRKSPLKSGGWLFFMVVCVSLAISAFYEFIEWWVAVLSGTAAEDFLALQGDIWDTQWDMFIAFIGSIVSQLLLSRAHDKSLKEAGFAP